MPGERTIEYQPALDGLRAVAVLLVLLYHHHGLVSGGIGSGGYIGVDVFFVLSGFLITSLLVTEHAFTGSIAFGRFWVRRLRRLIPALLVMLALVAVLSRYAYPQAVRWMVHDDLPWVLVYFENWHLVSGSGSVTSPLSHTWSLAIEEQWYLVWPLLLAAILFVTRDRKRPTVAVVAFLAVVSVAWGWYLESIGTFARLVFGTDVRAQELLVGASLGVLGTTWVRGRRWATTRAIGAAGLVGLGALIAVGLFAGEPRAWFSAGRFALACVAAVVILAAVAPRGVVRSILAWMPLVLVGRISYGLYLFHFPVFRWLQPVVTGLSGLPLLGLRVAVTALIATASYLIVERPVRDGHVPNLIVVPVGVAVATAVLLMTSTGLVAPLRPKSDLLAYVLGTAAAQSPEGAQRVLIVGGERAAALNQATVVTYDGQGIRGLAVGTLGCGLLSRTPRCSAVPDDLAALVASFRAHAVVLMPDEHDRAEFDQGVRSEADVEGRLDELRRAVGSRRLLVATVPCPPAVSDADLTFDAVLARWARRDAVRTGALVRGQCSIGSGGPSADEQWESVARLAGATAG